MLNVIHIELDKPILWKALNTVGGYVVAVCDELNLVIQSRPHELEEDMEESVFAMVEELLEQGLLEKFAQHHGWTVRTESTSATARPIGPPVHFNQSVKDIAHENQSQGVFA